MPEFFTRTDHFIEELDAAVEAHMDWTRRILRCVVLRTLPSDDVAAPNAHTLCRFGGWLSANRAHFEAVEAEATRRMERVHQTMHDAIRNLCASVLVAGAGSTDAFETFEQSQAELLALLARFKTLILSNAARQDPLTGLPLRYGIESDFLLCRKNALRHGNRLYLVIIDADRFKRINDRHGHPVGDMVLRHLATTLQGCVRGNEPLYRFGGEEFLLLMQCESTRAAEQTAQRILTTVRETPVRVPAAKRLTLTVTLGVAEVGDDETLASAVERADAALYDGKRGGRDRYVIASA